MKIQSNTLGVRRLIATLVLSVATIPSVLAGTPFSKVVVFGDSLNDRGNMLQFTGGAFPTTPTYYPGRQSNGRVWVEYLAARLGLADKIANYAVVGALTAPAPGYPTGNVWSVAETPGSITFPGLSGTDVAGQVSDHLVDSGGAADPAALYILEGGANDFPRVQDPSIIIGNLVRSMVALQTAGAKHLLVVTLPDIGKTPRVILGERFNKLPPGTGAYVSAVCAQINQGLLLAVQARTLPGVTVTMADAYGFMNQVAANATSYGMADVQQPYLLFGGGADAAKWLFWDDLHPTTRGHEIFADQVVNSLVRTYSPGKGSIGNGAINGLNGLVKAPGR